jgi:hypothetical protein
MMMKLPKDDIINLSDYGICSYNDKDIDQFIYATTSGIYLLIFDFKENKIFKNNKEQYLVYTNVKSIV